jgi:peptide/nickel transport system substrate-binding protein
MRGLILAASIGIAAIGLAPAAYPDDTPKHGGTLTYLIPADAPPSFDGHREQTYATVQAVAPYYSVLIRINPDNPASTTDFVCDLCTEMPQPTDGGKTYTFKIRDGVKFHDGTLLTADDIAASWNEIVFPPPGVFSPRVGTFKELIDKIEAPNPHTVVFRLKFATSVFLPAIADPYTFIYQKAQLDKDPHWYEKNILGSGPFKFASYEAGQSIKGVRNPDYYWPGKPYLDAIVGIFAPKQATRVDAIRSDQAQMEFRGMPPSAVNELKKELDGQIDVQESVWNCGSDLIFNHKRKPFDDARVRRALSLAIDRWGGAPALSKIAVVKEVGGIVFPNSPLAMPPEELHEVAGFWTDIEKSRTEAKRLLKEAGAANLSFELANRDVDQPYKYVGIWLIDQWSKIGLQVTQKVYPSGPWFETLRTANYSVAHYPICHATINPVLDVEPYLPESMSTEQYGYYDDPQEAELYKTMLHETDPQKQHQQMNAFQKLVMDTEAHATKIVWWNRIIPYRSYVKGFKIAPNHYTNMDMSTIWLDK